MKIGILGMGYVGCVTAACLAKNGHEVRGVELSEAKVQMLKQGIPPLFEPGLETLLKTGIAEERLSFSTEVEESNKPDLWIICVGTPSNSDGSFDGRALERVVKDVVESEGKVPIALRSTCLPEFFRERLLPIFQKSDVEFATVPEFLREGSAIRDFENAALSVIGCDYPDLAKLLGELFTAEALEVTDPITACSMKYACNAFHALKVAFANEIGAWSKAQGANAQDVMRMLCLDKKLNISSAYLRPGFAFGGSCLPKDLAAISHSKSENTIQPILLRAIELSNRGVIDAVSTKLKELPPGPIFLYGLAFKPGSDDLRGSPYCELAIACAKEKRDVMVFDSHVRPESLTGQNAQSLAEIADSPHIRFSESLDDLSGEAFQAVVLCHPVGESVRAALQNTWQKAIIVELSGASNLEGFVQEIWSPTF